MCLKMGRDGGRDGREREQKGIWKMRLGKLGKMEILRQLMRKDWNMKDEKGKYGKYRDSFLAAHLGSSAVHHTFVLALSQQSQ